MGFLDTLKQMATGKPLTITDRIYEDIKMQLDVCTCQDIQQRRKPF